MEDNKQYIDQCVRVDDALYEIGKIRPDMRVPVRIFATEQLLADIVHDKSIMQLLNVATLPGIVQYAYGMPDMHEGYGFPIGGVAGMTLDDGVISPGGIGYDINCGVRLLKSSFLRNEIEAKLPALAQEIFKKVPSGVGRGGLIQLSAGELDHVLTSGCTYMLKKGYGTERDVVFCEANGSLPSADPDQVSDHAKKRGLDQLGTLGSGNHFLEIQKVDAIFDEEAARAFGLQKDLVTVMIHCGSRGLGHQVCTDYIRQMIPLMEQFRISVPDRELVCAPFSSSIAQQYFNAMGAAANFAWANRHMIAHQVRQTWRDILGTDALDLVYDVSHNIGKVETHTIDGNPKKLIMHRKGATRAFGPGHADVPAAYRHVGQPVLVPGTMGTSSYVMAGGTESMSVALGSCCHGAGRKMSRVQARKTVRGTTVRTELAHKGIIVCSDSDSGLAEEAPLAYKDIEAVIDTIHINRLAKKVARLVPLAVIKGD